MATQTTDLDEMMKTLSAASTDPNSVSVGEFARAVQGLQAELKMLESEVERLGNAVGSAYGSLDEGTRRAKTPVTSDQADAKP
ncbi:MAG: hypothetical protein KKB37_07545 [Alphaproteobacteria bacterium]|nr:hypothetical protein [Alphaproteobacteria bacterium]